MSTALALSNLHLAVSDVDRAARFYVGVFGLEERYRADDGVVYLRIPGSRSHVALRYHSDAADRASRFGFATDTADTDSIVRRALSLGGSLVRRRDLGAGLVEVLVADPDGNVISLSAAGS